MYTLFHLLICFDNLPLRNSAFWEICLWGWQIHTSILCMSAYLSANLPMMNIMIFKTLLIMLIKWCLILICISLAKTKVCYNCMLFMLSIWIYFLETYPFLSLGHVLGRWVIFSLIHKQFFKKDIWIIFLVLSFCYLNLQVCIFRFTEVWFCFCF